jgi:hypothetical protein
MSSRRAILTLVLAVLALSAGSRRACASPWPDLVIGVGGTFGVAGEPSNGGFSAALSGMWPVEGPMAFGVTIFGDDMGTTLAQYRDANNPYISLGTYQQNHRWVYGAAWRFDFAPNIKGDWQPYGTGTWSYARVQDDQYGVVSSAESAAGYTIGAGIRHPIQKVHSLGLVVVYHRLLNERVNHYMSAALEWGWHFSSSKP